MICRGGQQTLQSELGGNTDLSLHFLVFLCACVGFLPDLFNRISRVELNDGLNSGVGVNVGFWDRSRKGCITTCIVQSDQLGLVQKTYTVADVPVHVVPVTVRLRFGNFDRCVWFSMLKSTDHGFVPISVPDDVGSGMVNVSVSVSFRQITNEKPVRPEEWEENLTFETVCRNKSQALALGNMTCDEACEQEPRCLVANELKSHCCFQWVRALQSEEVCKVENDEVPLVDRLLPGRSVEGTTWQGSARILRLGEAHQVDKSSANRSTIEWTFDLNYSNFGEYDLHLNQLGAEAMQNFGALLNLSMGTPKMQGAMAVLEANEQEDVDVSVESDPDQNQIIYLRPNENFSFVKSGFLRRLHVVPLIFGCILAMSCCQSRPFAALFARSKKWQAGDSCSSQVFSTMQVGGSFPFLQADLQDEAQKRRMSSAC